MPSPEPLKRGAGVHDGWSLFCNYRFWVCVFLGCLSGLSRVCDIVLHGCRMIFRCPWRGRPVPFRARSSPQAHEVKEGYLKRAPSKIHFAQLKHGFLRQNKGTPLCTRQCSGVSCIRIPAQCETQSFCSGIVEREGDREILI